MIGKRLRKSKRKRIMSSLHSKINLNWEKQKTVLMIPNKVKKG